MGDKKNLQQQEAIKKMQDLAEDIKIAMFCTYDSNRRIQATPMATQKIDDSGNIWFISDKNSDRNSDIQKNNEVDILYSHPGKESFVSIHGKASVLFDKKLIAEMWSPLAKTWFKEGKDDPNISLIKVMPEEGKYWDTKHGKMVSFIKMIASTVSDKTMDDGVEGKLQIH